MGQKNGEEGMIKGIRRNASSLSTPFCIVLSLRTMVWFHILSKIKKLVKSTTKAENPTLLQTL